MRDVKRVTRRQMLAILKHFPTTEIERIDRTVITVDGAFTFKYDRVLEDWVFGITQTEWKKEN